MGTAALSVGNTSERLRPPPSPQTPGRVPLLCVHLSIAKRTVMPFAAEFHTRRLFLFI